MKNNQFIIACITFVAMGLLLNACSNDTDYTPKPKGYLRMALPKQTYQSFNEPLLPYSFNYSLAAMVTEATGKNAQNKQWRNIEYPSLNATIFLSYKPMSSKNDFASYLDTATNFMSIHYQKSSGVGEQVYEDSENKIYGTIYHIKGDMVASPYQFWASDSNRHFLRGALYFHCTPNNDSLQPAIDFIQNDIKTLMSTLRWK